MTPWLDAVAILLVWVTDTDEPLGVIGTEIEVGIISGIPRVDLVTRCIATLTDEHAVSGFHVRLVVVGHASEACTASESGAREGRKVSEARERRRIFFRVLPLSPPHIRSVML